MNLEGNEKTRAVKALQALTLVPLATGERAEAGRTSPRPTDLPSSSSLLSPTTDRLDSLGFFLPCPPLANLPSRSSTSHSFACTVAAFIPVFISTSDHCESATMPTRRSAAATKAEASSSVSDVVAKASSRANDAQEKALEKRDDAKALVHNAATKRSKLPPAAQFPLAALLSFAMASLGYSLLGEVTKGELASVSRSQDTWTEVSVLAGWRL